MHPKFSRHAGITATAAVLLLATQSATASSHMDAPLITLDDAANTTDVYAFRSDANGVQYLTTAVAVYPFEEPGIGPNRYNFDDNVRYDIHVATGRDLKRGRSTLTYQFRFRTNTKFRDTILQSYLGVIKDIDDPAQNLTQSYAVRRIDRRNGTNRLLGTGLVPPNNQGLVTRFYNRGNNGNKKARPGVATTNKLDRYTRQGITTLSDGYRSFAGQRDDGFYADIQSVFDLDFTFSGPDKPFDSQRGYNVHTIALDIPLSELGGANQIIGVYATTNRRQTRVLRKNPGLRGDKLSGRFVQVGRQGNPLFNEAFVAIADKDRYNRSKPTKDQALFSKYALQPELARALVPLLGLPTNLLDNRTDLASIFIPDLIKVDLSTGPVSLAGGGPKHPTNPDDPDFSRLSIFGGDVLTSSVQSGAVPGGWPNGRRFGDDVLDIGVTAVISDLRGPTPIINGPVGDNVDSNDIAYNKVFPYAATPLNGRNHNHH